MHNFTDTYIDCALLQQFLFLLLFALL